MLNVLLIHAIEDPHTTRATTLRHLRAMERHSGWICRYHNGLDPVTDGLRAIQWDAIVFDASFLCHRWGRPRSDVKRLFDMQAWIDGTSAVKLAFPQDDYDHAHVLDDFLFERKVDVIYSIIPENRDLIYRKSKNHAEIKFALCGYVEDEDVELYTSHARPFASRGLDVGYRVRSIPAQFGAAGRLKSLFGYRFAAALPGDARADIQVGQESTLIGDDWVSFLGNCRFQLGSEGGSGVLDAYGEVKDRIDAARINHPDFSEDDLIEKILTVEDQRVSFLMPTPRIFEMAMAGCCPILLEGSYQHILTPNEHYISVRKDFSDIGVAVKALGDQREAKRIIGRLQTAVLDNPAYRYKTWVAGIVADVSSRIGTTVSRQNARMVDDLWNQHGMQLRAATQANAQKERRRFTGILLKLQEEAADAEAKRVSMEIAYAQELERAKKENADIDAQRISMEAAYIGEIERAKAEAREIEARRLELENAYAQDLERAKKEAADIDAQRISMEAAYIGEIERAKGEAREIEARRLELESAYAQDLERAKKENADIDAQRISMEAAYIGEIERAKAEAREIEARRLELENAYARDLERAKKEAADIDAQRISMEAAYIGEIERAKKETADIDAQRISMEAAYIGEIERAKKETADIDAQRISMERAYLEEFERIKMETAEIEARRISRETAFMDELARVRKEAADTQEAYTEIVEGVRSDLERINRTVSTLSAVVATEAEWNARQISELRSQLDSVVRAKGSGSRGGSGLFRLFRRTPPR